MKLVNSKLFMSKEDVAAAVKEYCNQQVFMRSGEISSVKHTRSGAVVCLINKIEKQPSEDSDDK